MCHLKHLMLFALFALATAAYNDQNDAPTFTTKGTNTTVRKGYPIRLHCGIDFDKDAFLVMWMNGSEFITAGETVMKHLDKINIHMSGIDLEIKNAQPEDEGVYTCRVSSSTRESQTHKVNVIYLENMELEPRKPSIDVKAGTKMDLKCTADGNPKPMAEWFHKGKRLEKAKFNHATGEMSVDNMKPHDAGTYECVMDNQSGERINKSIRVNVIASAQVMKKPENGKISVMTGDNVKLNCQVDGEGQVKIHWYFKGEQLSGKIGEEFQLENAKYSDAGTYKCKVMTEVFRNMEANFSVEVLHAPHIKCNNLLIHTGEGRSIDAICFVTADPEAMVSWHRHNHTLMPSHKISLLRDASTKKYELKIHKIRTTDFGRYTIVAKNDIGTAREHISLTGLPTPVAVNVEGEPEVNTKVKFSTKSFSPIFHFELNYRQVEHDVEERKWKMLTIPGEPSSIMFTQVYILRCLHVGAVYEIIMSAINEFGQSYSINPLKFKIKDSKNDTGHNCMVRDSLSLQAPSSSSSISSASSSGGSEAAAVESAPTTAPGSAPPAYRAASLISILTIVILVIFFC